MPHDPVALEEHFRDDDEGPVSNQGYMPYLNKFILEKVLSFHFHIYIMINLYSMAVEDFGTSDVCGDQRTVHTTRTLVWL